MSKFIYFICFILIGFKCISAVLIDDFSNHDSQFVYSEDFTNCGSILPNIYEKECFKKNNVFYKTPLQNKYPVGDPSFYRNWLAHEEKPMFYHNGATDNIKRIDVITKGTDIIESYRTLKGNWNFFNDPNSVSAIYCYKKGIFTTPLKITYEFPNNTWLDFEHISQLEFRFGLTKLALPQYWIQIQLVSLNGGKRVIKNAKISEDLFQIFKIEEYTDTKDFQANQISKIVFKFGPVDPECYDFNFFSIKKIESYPIQ